MKGTRFLKGFLAIIFSMVIAFSCAAVPAFAAANEDNGAGDALMVGVPADRCPVFYIDADTGEITGIGVDLMRAAAEEAGFTPTFKVIKEETLKDALDNTEYDVLMPFGSAIESTAGKETIVSENLIQTPFTLVTESGRELPPLNELRVGMLKSLAAGAETVSELFPGIDIVMYETMPDCVKALRAGEVDALLHNSYVWSYVLQKPSYSDLAVQPSTMFSMDFRAGTLNNAKGQAVIQRLDEGIRALEDTQRQAIVLDYTSRHLYKYDFSDYLHMYGVIILLGLLLIAALIVIAYLNQRAYRQKHEEEVRQLIEQDPLTGILSLDGFRGKAEELLRAHPDTPYYLSYNNIRDFKYINESLGREAGDELLKFWAAKSLETMSSEEAIGRIDADHFAVLRKIEGDEKMREDKVKVLEPVENYFADQGKEKKLQICSGIYVVTPEDCKKPDVDHMLDMARMAEKRAQDSREFNLAFYNPEQWEKGRRVADVIYYLPEAIESGDIQIWYQPQVDYAKRKIIGAEALCRWEHDKLGWLRPPAFITVLEEAGLIYDLDRHVWDLVCRDLKRWNEQGIHRSVSVNVSRCDIRENRDIAGQFNDMIKKYGLTVDQLRIEITETAYVENPELLIQTTKKLREYGFQVEMDDFGSGYSSLNMLKEVPIDRIKLDLNFLTEKGDPEKGRVIVSHMIQMVNSLGMSLIAEGVETTEQAQFLKEQGCSEMQGFYFYMPMSVEEFEQTGEDLCLEAQED